MVKFAKKLLRSRYPAWGQYYLDYKQLKKLLKKATRKNHSLFNRETSLASTASIRPITEENTQNEAVYLFRLRLETEIEKVALFFLRKQGELASRLSALREEQSSRINEIIVESEVARASPVTSGEFHHVDQYIAEIHDMMDGYRAVGEDMCHLIQYIHLNVTGVRKILKKHDKNIVYISLTQSFWAVEVAKTDFSHLPQLYRYEGIAALDMTIRQALNELNYFKRCIVDRTDMHHHPLLCVVDKTRDHDLMVVNDPILTKIEVVRRRLNQSNEFVNTMAKASNFFFEDSSEDEFSMLEDQIRPREVSRVSNFLNLGSTFLYMTNYYIVAPTSAAYSSKLGGDPALAGIVIGMTPISTLFSTILYSWWANHSYKSALLFGSCCSLIGNICYSLALPYDNFNLVLIGRLLNGFGGARAVNRRYIADTYSRDERTAASADFVTAGALGMSMGPALAAVFNYMQLDKDGDNTILTEETAPGWFMGILWTVYIIIFVAFFKEPHREDQVEKDELQIVESYGATDPDEKKSNEGFQISAGTNDESLVTTKEAESLLTNAPVMMTLTLYFVLKLVLESLFSSEPTVTSHYFQWDSFISGNFLAVLGILIFPANVCLAKLSYIYDDRDIIYTITIAMLLGIIGIISYENIIPYTEPQYVLAAICIFITTNVLEGASMSLLSKTIPHSYAKGVFNSGFLATEAGTLGRAVGDIFISYVGTFGISFILNGVFVTQACIVAITCIILHKTYPYLKPLKDKDDNDSSSPLDFDDDLSERSSLISHNVASDLSLEEE